MRSAERRCLSSQQLRQDLLVAPRRESHRQPLRDRWQVQMPSKIGADGRKLEVFRPSLNASLERVSLLGSQVFTDGPTDGPSRVLRLVAVDSVHQEQKGSYRPVRRVAKPAAFVRPLPP